jgi:hypothetical protein
MVQTCSDNEQGENPKEGFEHESYWKMSKEKDQDGNNRLGKMLQRRRKTVG